jgi:hypothetical protein
MGVMRLASAMLTLSLDCLIFASAVLFSAIFVSGGFVLTIAGHGVSLLRSRNVLTLVFSLSIVRYLLFSRMPFFLRPTWNLKQFPALASTLCSCLFSLLERITPQLARRVVFAIMAASFLMKAANALYYGGSHTGTM